ncbi:MAG: helix-turn-helix domain-containing protein [Phycisphaerales bacterium]|nr:helix-turn-helix domain-containing protein [Phycisphaerales bacterium]
MANDNSVTKVPALERGLDVLESMHTQESALTLTAIARRCGRSVSELQRVIACLHNRGYLLRDVTGAYRVSSKIFRMGQACSPFQDLLVHAWAPMRQFAGQTGQSVHISVLSEDQLLILANVSGSGYLQLGVAAGSTHDPIMSASGRVLLASMDGKELVGFLKRNKVSAQRAGPLQLRLGLIRRRGYELVPSHLYRGLFDLALCAPAQEGLLVAAVACSYLRPRQGLQGQQMPAPSRLLRKLRQCAGGISAAFEPQTIACEEETR